MSGVLVTGATGFIGGHVVRELLHDGHDVVGVSRHPLRPETRHILGHETDRLRLEVLAADDEDGLRRVCERHRPDGIVHVDAVVDVVELRTAPLRALESNVLPTIGLLEIARDTGVQDFVYLSSIAVLPTVQVEPIPVRHPFVTETEGPGGGFYGASKAAAEVFTLEYAASFGMNVRIVRPSAVYGFGMQWPIGLKPLVEGGVDGIDVDLGTQRMPARDFTHVADVAGVVSRLLERPDTAQRVFFAATGRSLVSEEQLIETVRRQLPDLRVRFEPGAGTDVSVESAYRGVLDVSALRDELGYALRFPDLSEGIAEYIGAYRAFRGA
ncbi:NAD(P)-dependent oxidoreductase [Streptomyces sp. NPDC052676]|uniref:NAD-dependent epimerase/dehydratase family protein n=1 Tax=Streptomyces sp. NPDC052676 TaxID=3154953 RepID=UPI0034368B17